MSMPSGLIYCDSCEFNTRTSVIWGRYQYQLKDGNHIPINRIFGWCYNCDTIRPVEDLSDKRKIEAEVQRIKGELSSIERPGLLNLIRRNIGHLKYNHENLSNQLKENLMRLNFLEHRRSSPKCLYCSSDRVQPITLSIIPKENGISVKIAFVHPNCDGYLWLKNDGLRLNMKFTPRYYDLDGYYLGEDTNI